MESQTNYPPQQQDNSSGANTVLLVVIILIIAAGGYWWYTHPSVPSTTDNSTINIINLPIGTSTKP